MISTAQANEYLDKSLGITLPDFLVRAAVERVEAAEPAMFAAGYSEAVQVQVQCMAVALIAAAGAPRRIGSQGAPSGASRSFKYADTDLSQLRRALNTLDTAGTVAGLIGQDTAAGTLLLVV